MKKSLVMLASVVFIGLISAGSYALFGMPDSLPEKTKKKSCTGYEIIEAGKGVNCHGDTIKLTKRSGFYEVASNTTPTKF
jgi:hypothetical protein